MLIWDISSLQRSVIQNCVLQLIICILYFHLVMLVVHYVKVVFLFDIFHIFLSICLLPVLSEVKCSMINS